MQYKLRSIIKSASRNVEGVMFPQEIAQFFSGCYFNVNVIKIGSRYGVFCESGALNIPTMKQVEEFNFSECRI